jgi:hypothetical protein
MLTYDQKRKQERERRHLITSTLLIVIPACAFAVMAPLQAMDMIDLPWYWLTAPLWIHLTGDVCMLIAMALRPYIQRFRDVILVARIRRKLDEKGLTKKEQP